MRMVAVKVHVPVLASRDALLDPISIGIGNAGQLRDAELKAKPRDELKRGEAEEWVGERELEHSRCRACAGMRVHEVAAAQRLLLGAQRAQCRLVNASRPFLLQFRNHKFFIGVRFHVA